MHAALFIILFIVFSPDSNRYAKFYWTAAFSLSEPFDYMGKDTVFITDSQHFYWRLWFCDFVRLMSQVNKELQ